MNEKKNKLDVDYNLLKEQYSTLEEKNNKTSEELKIVKELQEKKLNELDNKLAEILKEIDKWEFINAKWEQ